MQPMKTSSKKTKPHSKIENAIFYSWWVVLFILGCYMSYEHSLEKRDRDFAILHQQYMELLRKKNVLKTQQEALHRQINSQSDPAWVELILMKGLGLTPEGQTKVLFTNQMENFKQSRVK
jgi:hypothetical protein